MKKALALIFCIVNAFIGYSQERVVPSATSYYTFDRNENGRNYSEYTYTGTSSDYLIPTTRDIIDFQYDTKKAVPFRVSYTVVYDTIAGADSTVTVQIFGRDTEYDSWNLITTGVSADIGGETVQKVTYGNTATIAAFDVPFTDPAAETADTLKVPVQTITFNDVNYQYILVRHILTGDGTSGTGVKLVYNKLKLRL